MKKYIEIKESSVPYDNKGEASNYPGPGFYINTDPDPRGEVEFIFVDIRGNYAPWILAYGRQEVDRLLSIAEEIEDNKPLETLPQAASIPGDLLLRILALEKGEKYKDITKQSE